MRAAPLALLGALVVVLAGIAPAVAATDSGSGVAIEGHVAGVDGVDGNVSVVVGSAAMLEKSSPERLRRVAANPPDDVAVTRTDADGDYAMTVPDAVDAEAVVAVGPDGVSRVRRIDGDGTYDLTLFSGKPLRFSVTTAVTEPGGRDTVTIRVKNTGDAPVENLRLAVGRFPSGWNLVGTNAEGATFDPDSRTFTWESVPAGEWAEAKLRLFVGINASTGEYEVPMFAASDTNPTTSENLTVEVRYPTTAPEQTAVGGGDGEGGNDGVGGTGIGAPGFGPVVAGVALVALAALLAHRPE